MASKMYQQPALIYCVAPRQRRPVGRPSLFNGPVVLVVTPAALRAACQQPQHRMPTGLPSSKMPHSKLLATALLACALFGSAAVAEPVEGLAMHGTPKHAPGFT